VGIDWRSCWW